MSQQFNNFDGSLGDEEEPHYTQATEVWPRWAHEFLENLAMNGSVAASARMVGLTRTTAYKLAARSPLFAKAMKEAKLEFRDLLLGTAHRFAISGAHDSVLNKLLGLYFPQAINRDTGAVRIDPSKITDEEIGHVAGDPLDAYDLSNLADDELEALGQLLDRASGSPSGAG